MKIHSVKFKDKSSFEKNKNKTNVLEVHEPFGIIVFADEEEVEINPNKVSQSNEVESDLTQLPSGLVILTTLNNARLKEYLELNKIKIVDIYNTTNTFIVELGDFMDYDSFAHELIKLDLVTSVEQDFIRKEVKDAVNDFYSINSQWHLDNIKAELAWAQIPADAIGDVAVLDCSCETTHEDMGALAFNANWNCVTNTSNVEPINDNAKHGTPCSGIINARTNNNLGVSSIGFNKLRVQFLNIGYNETTSGGFSTSDAICTMAINKAIENPTCLAISMSWGGGGSKPAFENALNVARTQGRNGKGIPIFASSGNSAINGFTQLPAAYPAVMAIGASTISNTKASFSNYGTKLFAAAPGTSIRTVDRSGAKGYTSSASLDPRVENYTSFSGTSAACPLFAGVAAAVLLKNPNLTEAQLRTILAQACRKTGGYVYNSSGWCNELGYGVIDYNQAMLLAGTSTPPVESHDLTTTVTCQNTIVNNIPLPISFTVSTNKPNLESKTFQCQVFITTSPSISTSATPIFTTNVTLGQGVPSTTNQFNYTIPTGTTGTRYITVKVDTLNSVQETNENNNTAQTTVNFTLPVGDPNCDMSVEILGYEWGKDSMGDFLRIPIRYRNLGLTTITSYKTVVGFLNGMPLTRTSTSSINPGATLNVINAFRSSMLVNSYPSTFQLKITEVNGASDINQSNNTATILINK